MKKYKSLLLPFFLLFCLATQGLAQETRRPFTTSR
jgi:hypothetical protein